MTGGGDVIKKGIDKVQDAKSHAGDPAALTTVTTDSEVDPTITRVQFQPKDYRVSKIVIPYHIWALDQFNPAASGSGKFAS